VIARSRRVRFANVVRRIPCPDSSAEAVYSSHMIEHLDRREAQAFLAEVRRVLMPGGVVRLAAPDLARLVHGYVTDGNANEFIVATHMAQPRPAGLLQRLSLALTGPRHHLWMYDGRSLSSLLLCAGFEDVCVIPPGTTKISDPGQLDLEERAAESVYVEGQRS
jgi:predicted SAM-dependent methyltransferase